MTHLELEIRDGPRSRVVPPAALAAMLHLRPHDLRDALFVLLDPIRFQAALEGSDTPGEGEMTEGEMTEGEERFGTFPIPKANISERFDRKGEGPGEGNPESPWTTARRIGRTLGDEQSIAGIEVLVRSHPKPLIDEALRRTLQIPPERVRKSRGACFTGIVRTLAQLGYGTPNSHAHA